MRVLHFYRTYFPDTVGGIEQAIRQMAAGTTRLGIANEVLTLTRSKEDRLLDWEGHKIHRARLNWELASTGFSLPALWRFAELARSADLIHYHFPWPFMDLAHMLVRIRKPSIVTYHSDIVRQKRLLALYRPLKRWFLNDVDRIVATSPNYLATSPILGRYRNKTEIITYGLDRASYPAPRLAVLNRWLERLGVGQKFFLFVGVLRYYKGLHVLLRAAAGTSMPVLIVGEGPQEEELKRQAREVGLRNVHFLGSLPEEDKAVLLTLCYAVVFPSHLRSEAFGISLLEGAMYGKPMISSEIGTGTSYVNIANETGLVVPPEDAPALRRAMQYLWDHPQRAEEMGARAAQRYEKLFTSERMARAYAGLYQQVIATSNRNK
jgi:rhamnosyl/mannosyltransferase